MESSYAHFLTHPYIYDVPDYDDYIAEPERAVQRYRDDVELKFNEICKEAEVDRPTIKRNENRSFQELEEIFDVASYCADRASEQQVTLHHDSHSTTTTSTHTTDGDNSSSSFNNTTDHDAADTSNVHLPLTTSLLYVEQIETLVKVYEALRAPEMMTDELLAQVTPFVPLLLEEARSVPVKSNFRATSSF